MADVIQHGHQQRGRVWLRYVLAILGLVVILGLALRFINLADLRRVVANANPWWLLGALFFKAITPLGTAAVYSRVLSLLGHQVRTWQLWLTAQVAIFVNMAFPAGPLAMSALLLHAFRRRKVPEGITTLAVALDSLTYETAFFSLVGFGLSYLLTHQELSVRQISEVSILALLIVIVGMYVWGLQRDRADLTRKVIGVQQWLARRLRRPWRSEDVEGFLNELYRGKALISERPWEFARLLGLQVVVLFLDVMTLYCAFRALGSDPHLSVIMLSYALSSFFAALAPLPGGGGSFEATLVLTASRLGVPSEVALGATLIYRVLTFWLPAILTALTYRLVLGSSDSLEETA